MNTTFFIPGHPMLTLQNLDEFLQKDERAILERCEDGLTVKINAFTETLLGQIFATMGLDMKSLYRYLEVAGLTVIKVDVECPENTKALTEPKPWISSLPPSECIMEFDIDVETKQIIVNRYTYAIIKNAFANICEEFNIDLTWEKFLSLYPLTLVIQ